MAVPRWRAIVYVESPLHNLARHFSPRAHCITLSVLYLVKQTQNVTSKDGNKFKNFNFV